MFVAAQVSVTGDGLEIWVFSRICG
jgi:hypothetical protein